MIIDELPLIELFSKLREAGLPLGIEEYKLLLEALQKGFGVKDRDSLKRLLLTLWVKSPEDKRLFDYEFELLVKDTPNMAPTIAPENPEAHPQSIDEKNPASETTQGDDPKPSDESISQPQPPSPPLNPPSAELTLLLEDEAQAAQAVRLTSADEAEINYNKFIMTSEYFPVTKRQMKQSWRYLRRPVREGQPVELDLEATVGQIARQGMFLAPALIPPRVNRVQLVLLIDRDGSMVPFHLLSQRLAETAIRGGRLGSTDIYYFHNSPINYIYRDSSLVEAEILQHWLNKLNFERSVVLIFSDAGAARGGYSEERIDLTKKFLNQLKTKVKYAVWLNPMPKNRWGETTAREIANMLPMFELNRQGLQQACSLKKR